MAVLRRSLIDRLGRALCAASLGFCAVSAGTAAQARDGVEVARTQYGVVHVKADDTEGLGFGIGYVHSLDNICLMADYFMGLNGERSQYIGEGGEGAPNVSKDMFARYYLRPDLIETYYASIAPDVRALLDGYVQGYNSYLAEAGSTGLPEACRGKPWVRPITLRDMYLALEDRNILMSGGRYRTALVAAAPPGQAPAKIAYEGGPHYEDNEGHAAMGSNGWAFGGDVTEAGRGLVVGNPHFPWQGPNRFYQMHLTIPGKLDVMGAGLAPQPLVSIGFNRDVAWTHTVSNGARHTLFELQLDPSDPMTYRVNGRSYRVTEVPVTVDVRQDDGSLKPVTHIFYESRFGPLVILPEDGLDWTRQRAYALADVNRFTPGASSIWLAMGKSRSVADLRRALSRGGGLQWVNTIAADRHGDALYADASRIPTIDDRRLASCLSTNPDTAKLRAKRVFLLDGSRLACDWRKPAAQGGLRAAPIAEMPSMVRRDYVANSNNSYWLVQPAAPFPAHSPLAGEVDEEQNLRTRKGHLSIARLLASSARPISLAAAQRLQFANENYAAQLVLDDLLHLCGTRPDLAEACGVLARWDRRNDLDSRGAILFKEIWDQLWDKPVFKTPFSPRDPLNTPADLDVQNPEARERLLAAITTAVDKITALGFALDVPLGEVQLSAGPGPRVPIHGGDGTAGVLNMIRTSPLSASGYEPVHGTSYLQIVTFDDKGPLADAVLAYSQSTDPGSPHLVDQTQVYSRKALYRLPFDYADIVADPGYRRIELPPRR